MHITKDFGSTPKGDSYFQYTATVEGRIFHARRECSITELRYLEYIKRDLEDLIMREIKKVLFNDTK